MIKNLTLTFILITAIVNVALSQDTVFFNRNTSITHKSKKKPINESNIIKIAPLSFISGFVPVYYEKEITPFFSVQVGLGPTIHNYMAEWTAGIANNASSDLKSTHWNDGTTNKYDNIYEPEDYTNRKSTVGMFFSIEPRIYFESDGLEGPYLGVALNKYQYKSNSKTIIASNSSTPTFSNNNFSETKNVSDIMVSFGNQSLLERISLDYSIGLGIRGIKGKRYIYGYNYNTSQTVDGYGDISANKFAFNVSIKVGYHF